MKKYILLNILVLILLGCHRPNEINKLLRSNNVSDLINANDIIGETKDTTFVCELLKNIYDCRSINRGFRSSIYYSKVIALKKISGLKPPNKITANPDSLIVNFYTDWAKKKGYKCIN